VSKQTDMVYGFFHGGDPRKFYPDEECCTERELADHKAACALWNEAEARGETPTPEACPSGWEYDADGKPLRHVLRSTYGMGTYEYEYEVVDGDDADQGMNTEVSSR
jgi:hypothetical protein